MEPEIITKRMVGECSSSVTDSNFKANFQEEFELFSKNKIYANNHTMVDTKIVSIIKKNIKFVQIRPYNFKK